MDTPTALIDVTRMQRNILRMQRQADALGVSLRPHVKTHKCIEVVTAQKQDFGYGQACTEAGEVIDGLLLGSANQEHGVAWCSDASVNVVEQFALGTRLRILPNHACATGTQFDSYSALLPNDEIQVWKRLRGW